MAWQQVLLPALQDCIWTWALISLAWPHSTWNRGAVEPWSRGIVSVGLLPPCITNSAYGAAANGNQTWHGSDRRTCGRTGT